jgi:hypothetical protein
VGLPARSPHSPHPRSSPVAALQVGEHQGDGWVSAVVELETIYLAADAA